MEKLYDVFEVEELEERLEMTALAGGPDDEGVDFGVEVDSGGGISGTLSWSF